jgi:sulfonate transport system substrate-binding protein
MNRTGLGTLIVGVVVLAVAACGMSAKPRDGGAVTLRVGTLGTTKALFQAAGQDRNLPYRIEWSVFPAGPQLIEAERANAVDVGETAETPPIFAQAAHAPVKIVAAEKLKNGSLSPLGIIVSNGSPITDPAQLKGRKVGITQGTIVQYFAIKVLERAGLTYSDVTPVNLAPEDGVAALRRGDIDALSCIDPTLAHATMTGAKVLVSGSGYVAGHNYQVARIDLLNNHRVAAALVDFLRRSVRSREWAATHPVEWAAAYAKVNNIPLNLAKVTTSRAEFEYIPIDDGVVTAQQDEADLFRRLGLLPQPLSVQEEFDRRFNGQLN